VTAVWLTATYTTTALLIAVRLGRRLRNQGDDMDSPIYAELRRKAVNAAVYERLAFVGDSDFEEWHIELLTSEGDSGADYDGLRYAAGWMVMAALPMPEFDGEDHL
jgi:hypothetical protein